MKARKASGQLDFLGLLGIAEPQAPPPPPGCPLAELLIAAGLVPSTFYLDLNRGLTNPHKVEIPSRLYRFPIEYMAADRRRDGCSKLLLRSPFLGDHPFIREVEAAIGASVEWEDQDEFGRDRGSLPRWWHAVDLMNDRHWLDLMNTRHLTSPDDLVHAVAFALETPASYEGKKSGPSLSLDHARRVLTMLDVPEPADRSEAEILGRGIFPAHIVERDGKGKVKSERWPLNVRNGPLSAWMVLHGIEDGWFARTRSGYLNTTPKCRDARASAESVPA